MNVFFILFGVLVLGRTVTIAVLAIRKFGLAAVRESRLLVAHLLLFAAAGLVSLIGAGVERSRVAAFITFGAILLADSVMRWVGLKVTPQAS